MKKKTSPNEMTQFYRRFDFFLSPMDFLAIVWVYQHEILPVFKKCHSEEFQTPKDINLFIREIRYHILNGELSQLQLTQKELRYFINQSKNLFAPFAQVTEQVPSPTKDQIYSARNSLTDFIVLDDIGNLAELDSSLIDGNITFTLSKVTVLPPY